jgi:hypothetical protein
MSRLKDPALGRLHRRYMPYKDLTVIYEGSSANVPVRVPDLSVTGMFVNTPQQFPEGAVLKVRFRLPRTDTWVAARAEVRYVVEGVGLGVEFVEISAASQRAISEELELQELEGSEEGGR